MGIPTVTKVALHDATAPTTTAGEGLSADQHSALVERLAHFDRAADAKRELDAARNALESSMNECNELLGNSEGRDNEQKNALVEAMTAASAELETLTRNTQPSALQAHVETLKSAATAFRGTLKPAKAAKESADEGGPSRPKRASNRDKAYAREQMKKERQKHADKEKAEKAKAEKAEKAAKAKAKSKQEL
jgi:hypothetical protein